MNGEAIQSELEWQAGVSPVTVHWELVVPEAWRLALIDPTPETVSGQRDRQRLAPSLPSSKSHQCRSVFDTHPVLVPNCVCVWVGLSVHQKAHTLLNQWPTFFKTVKCVYFHIR